MKNTNDFSHVDMKLDSEISKLQGRTLVEQIDVLSERLDIETEHRCNDCRSLQERVHVLEKVAHSLNEKVDVLGRVAMILIERYDSDVLEEERNGHASQSE